MSIIALNTNVAAVMRRLGKTDAKLRYVRIVRFAPEKGQSGGHGIARSLSSFLLRLLSSFVISKFNRIAEDLSDVFVDLTRFRSAFNSEMVKDEVIDDDMALYQLLAGLKEKHLGLLKNMQETRASLPPAFADIRTSLDRLISISVECCNEINALQWDIAEHDAPLLGRVESMPASSKEEMDSLLERITAV